ncbi:MAG: PhzF family phenazine biosynthesis protein [Planctomycetota bacterium]
MPKVFVVDAFADRRFAGNQAAVCLLDSEAPEDWLQEFAGEMNYSETAYLVPNGDAYNLRWFTPAYEVDLCGHATLASSHVLWNECGIDDEELHFETRSGRLKARRAGSSIQLDFPVTQVNEMALGDELLECLNLPIAPAFTGRTPFDAFVALEDERQVRELAPDFARLAIVDTRGVIVTAPSEGEHDFISRFFAPSAGINEDPVTGSAHCSLATYWAPKLGRNKLQGYQASQRGGVVGVELVGDRVCLSGEAITIVRGELAKDACT